jgi:hypothetical protein
VPSPAINPATTFENIPCFVPVGVLWYTEDTDNLYAGTGISDNGGTPGVVQIAGNGSGVPIVTASLQVVNATTVETLSIMSPTGVPTLYACSLYMKALGTGGTGHTYTETITYTSPDDGDVQTITLILPLDHSNVVMETYPLMVKGGTTLSATGTYGGGATDDPYTLSIRLVSIPLEG